MAAPRERPFGHAWGGQDRAAQAERLLESIRVSPAGGASCFSVLAAERFASGEMGLPGGAHRGSDIGGGLLVSANGVADQHRDVQFRRESITLYGAPTLVSLAYCFFGIHMEFPNNPLQGDGGYAPAHEMGRSRGQANPELASP